MTTREADLFTTMVDLADTLVDDFDVVDLLSLLAQRCTDLFEVEAAGIMLAAPDGHLQLMASSSETMRLVELFEIQSDEGPCMDCYRSGQGTVAADLGAPDERWPRFATFALGAGFQAAHALPLRLRGRTIGALNLFRVDPGPLDPRDVTAAQALADIATIAILQHRVSIEAQVLNEQLTHALNSRIVIEQAKGVLAEQSGLAMDVAFERLRTYSRGHRLRLAEVARDVVSGELDATSLDAPGSPPGI